MRGHYSRWRIAIACVLGLCGWVSGQTPEGVQEEVKLIVGRSTVVRAPWATARVAVTDPKIADVQVLTAEQVLVQGIKVGTTDLILWSEDDQQTVHMRVVVRMDLEAIEKTITTLFPGANLAVSDSGEVLVIQGLLRSSDQALQLKDFLEKSKIPYVNMTSLAGVQQVQLQVRIAEVSRSALRQLGVNAVGTDDDFFFGQKVGGVSPSIDIGPAGQTFPPVSLDNMAWATPDDGITAGSSVTLFAGFPKADLEVYLSALAENQYVRVLANPTLIALSGEEAEFLAGGEFPIPVPQTSGGGASTITIEYKEFGVRLMFRPLVLGDGGIRLTAMQEVSELSDAGGLVIEGFAVPALTTRRAAATLELKSGQSFALAGLLRSTDAAITSRIPGLGDLPIIGPMFRSIRYRNQETELVILVTASLVEPMSVDQAPPLPGVTHQAPSDWELYVEGRIESQEPARIDPASQQWLREMGLDKLVGPGAWDTYEEQDFNATMRAAEATQSANAAAVTAAEQEKAAQPKASGPWPNPAGLTPEH